MNKPVNVRITEDLKNPTVPGTYYRLLCMTGPCKGKVYYLIGKRIIIGRGDNADIQIVDVKISREHAELSFSANGYTITDLGAQNGILVNSTKITQKRLNDAEKVVIGQTVFKYNIIVVANTEVITSSEDDNDNEDDEDKIPKKLIKSVKNSFNDKISGPVVKNKNKGEGKKSNPRSMIFIILILAAGYFLFFDAGDKSKNNGAGNTNSIAPRDFDKDFVSFPENKKNTQEDAESKRKLDNYIHSGRREFGEGNYFRAMEDFRLALLLSPNNGHASFYLSKAKQSLDDDINKNFLKGKQESESKKLQAAIISYCGVVQLIQNYPNDERYKSAMMKISAIESELGMEKGEVKCFEEKSADSRN
jgi:pSer/pThr/pTyr-binding forkhead associated (FHA) protein